jgi:hydroxymethylpyrimidine/phosphomethylpyrimidine kinase
MAVPLAETVQSGLGCDAILPPAAPPLERLDSLAPHLRGGWGAKMSMFFDCGALRGVVPRIQGLAPIAAIWDPVMAPSSGVPLHDKESMGEAVGLLSGGGWVMSPNLHEARAIAGLPAAPLEAVAERLLAMGFQGVWIRGGHGGGEDVRDLWCDGGGPVWLAPRRRLAGDPRGTGCTATAAWLALRLGGMGAVQAAEGAIDYVRKAWAGLHLPGDVGRPTFPPRVV